MSRELRREKGQFWTPAWVAEAMVAYVLAGGSDGLFDPAVGTGAFFRAARVLETRLGRRVRLKGTEIDPRPLREALLSGLSEDDVATVEIRDFVLNPPAGPFEAIVANPPYIRHHRLAPTVKAKLREIAIQIIGRPLDGRAGLHVYFLVRALQLLHPERGCLAFIMPADTCEGVFAPILWAWIRRHYTIDAVVTFGSEASPFPEVDVNPIIFMIRRGYRTSRLMWARCTEPGTPVLKEWVLTGFKQRPGSGLVVYERDLEEALRTGLSRPPCETKRAGPVLGDFAVVRRGIATGANEFFFLTRQKARELGIPDNFLIPAVGRTRDVPGDALDANLLDRLDRQGRPTLLFCPDDRPAHEFPASVRRYLEEGERRGLPKRPLLGTRQPWYKMERRKPPQILFAYLGRRNARFVINLAGAVPLTAFLCIYPRSEDPAFIRKLWLVLSHPDTRANLPAVSKSYGSGCIKVEPRALERLPLPERLIRRFGLAMVAPPAQTVLPLERELSVER